MFTFVYSERSLRTSQMSAAAPRFLDPDGSASYGDATGRVQTPLSLDLLCPPVTRPRWFLCQAETRRSSGRKERKQVRTTEARKSDRRWLVPDSWGGGVVQEESVKASVLANLANVLDPSNSWLWL